MSRSQSRDPESAEDPAQQRARQVLDEVVGTLTMLLSASTRVVPPPVDFALGEALEALQAEVGPPPMTGNGTQPATVDALAHLLTAQCEALLTAAADLPRAERLRAMAAAAHLQPWSRVVAIVEAHEAWGSRPPRDRSIFSRHSTRTGDAGAGGASGQRPTRP